MDARMNIKLLAPDPFTGDQDTLLDKSAELKKMPMVPDSMSR